MMSPATSATRAMAMSPIGFARIAAVRAPTAPLRVVVPVAR